MVHRRAAQVDVRHHIGDSLLRFLSITNVTLKNYPMI